MDDRSQETTHGSASSQGKIITQNPGLLAMLRERTQERSSPQPSTVNKIYVEEPPSASLDEQKYKFISTQVDDYDDDQERALQYIESSRDAHHVAYDNGSSQNGATSGGIVSNQRRGTDHMSNTSRHGSSSKETKPSSVSSNGHTVNGYHSGLLKDTSRSNSQNLPHSGQSRNHYSGARGRKSPSSISYVLAGSGQQSRISGQRSNARNSPMEEPKRKSPTMLTPIKAPFSAENQNELEEIRALQEEQEYQQQLKDRLSVHKSIDETLDLYDDGSADSLEDERLPGADDVRLSRDSLEFGSPPSKTTDFRNHVHNHSNQQEEGRVPPLPRFMPDLKSLNEMYNPQRPSTEAQPNTYYLSDPTANHYQGLQDPISHENVETSDQQSRYVQPTAKHFSSMPDMRNVPRNTNLAHNKLTDPSDMRSIQPSRHHALPQPVTAPPGQRGHGTYEREAENRAMHHGPVDYQQRHGDGMSPEVVARQRDSNAWQHNQAIFDQQEAEHIAAGFTQSNQNVQPAQLVLAKPSESAPVIYPDPILPYNGSTEEPAPSNDKLMEDYYSFLLNERAKAKQQQTHKMDKENSPPTHSDQPSLRHHDVSAQPPVTVPPRPAVDFINTNKEVLRNPQKKTYGQIQSRRIETKELFDAQAAYHAKRKVPKREPEVKPVVEEQVEVEEEPNEIRTAAEELWHQKAKSLALRKKQKTSTPGKQSKPSSRKVSVNSLGTNKQNQPPPARQNFEQTDYYSLETREPIRADLEIDPNLVDTSQPIRHTLITDDGQRVNVDINLKVLSPQHGQTSPHQGMRPMGPVRPAIHPSNRQPALLDKTQKQVHAEPASLYAAYHDPSANQHQMPGKQRAEVIDYQIFDKYHTNEAAPGGNLLKQEGVYSTYVPPSQQPPRAANHDGVLSTYTGPGNVTRRVPTPYRVLPPIGYDDTGQDVEQERDYPEFDAPVSPRREQTKGSYLDQYQKQKGKQEIQYKQYTLKDYKKLKHEIRLGGLGPDDGNPTHQERKDKMHRQNEYARFIQEKNRQELQEALAKSPRHLPTVDQDNTEEINRRKIAIDYAKSLMKPRISPKKKAGSAPTSNPGSKDKPVTPDRKANSSVYFPQRSQSKSRSPLSSQVNSNPDKTSSQTSKREGTPTRTAQPDKAPSGTVELIDLQELQKRHDQERQRVAQMLGQIDNPVTPKA